MTATIHQFPRRDYDALVDQVTIALDRMTTEDFKRFLEALKAPLPQDRKAGR